MAKQSINWWIVAGLILLVLYLGKGTFLGSILTTCENNEPKDVAEFIASMDSLNGTIDQVAPFTVMQESGLAEYQRYTASSPFGVFDIINPGNQSCSQFVAIVDQMTNNSDYVTLSERQVLLTNDGYLWCNYVNNLALRAVSVQTFSGYYGKYVVCTTEEVAEITQVTEPVCSVKGGEWNGTTCICSDDTILQPGESCMQRQETTNEQPVTVPQQVTQEPVTVSDRTSFTKSQWIGGIALIAAVLFLAYWLFEKGPSKGLIRGRRR